MPNNVLTYTTYGASDRLCSSFTSTGGSSTEGACHVTAALIKPLLQPHITALCPIWGFANTVLTVQIACISILQNILAWTLDNPWVLKLSFFNTLHTRGTNNGKTLHRGTTMSWHARCALWAAQVLTSRAWTAQVWATKLSTVLTRQPVAK